MDYFLKTLWSSEEGQDVAEYSIMLAVILVIAVGTVRLIGSNAEGPGTFFRSQPASCEEHAGLTQ
jgi:hypothetical protein